MLVPILLHFALVVVYYEINYRGALKKVPYSRNFVFEGVVILRFHCILFQERR
jgi:hypothetical protein